MGRLRYAAGLGLLLLSGCATVQRGMCSAPARRGELATPDTWTALLLHGYTPPAGPVPHPALDCMGLPVMWQEPRADECREPGPVAEPLPPTRTLAEQDLLIERLTPTRSLIWVITQRFTNGEALGPVGLVERTEDAFVIKAVGPLRAFPEQAHLRLERTGGHELLVAEGSVCTSDQPPVCRRMARLLPIRFGRFMSEPVVSRDGQCLGPGWFPLGREQEFELPNGWHRKFELTSTLKLEGDRIIQNEQVEVTDSDPRHPNLRPRLNRRATSERTLQVGDDRTVGSAPSLWQRLVEQQLAAGAKTLAPRPVALQPAPPGTAAPALAGKQPVDPGASPARPPTPQLEANARGSGQAPARPGDARAEQSRASQGAQLPAPAAAQGAVGDVSAPDLPDGPLDSSGKGGKLSPARSSAGLPEKAAIPAKVNLPLQPQLPELGGD